MASPRSCASVGKDYPDYSSLCTESGHVEPFIAESCLPGNSFYQVIQDLLLFENQIGRRFLTSDAVYKYTCGRTDCNFTCGVPHLMMIVRVRGLADDQIGIILHTAGKAILNILPQDPRGRYSYRTWRNSRFHIIRRMVLCSYLYYRYGDIQRITRLASKPLRVYVFGYVMGKVLDLQKRFLLGNPYKLEDEESEKLLPKEFQ